MTPEHDKYLCETYPEIFKNRHGDPMKTAMCWGFDCGDGWFDLIDTFCKTIMGKVYIERKTLTYLRSGKTLRPTTPEELVRAEERLRMAEAAIPVCEQVKEKWGALRIYMDNLSHEGQAILDYMEALSETICMNCGAPGDMRISAWVHVYCDKCEDEHQTALKTTR